MFFARALPDPAVEVTRRVRRLERQNSTSVRWDHRFGAVGVLTIAIAALIGMSAESIVAALGGTMSRADIMQLVAAFFGVLVMNRGLLAAARNIRRAESRGDVTLLRDRVTMWGVMAIESISFAYMLWTFENHPSMLSVQGLLLVARAAIIPFSTVYLEMQREQPPDPIDISVETEIGQGLGVMSDLVTQAYDRDIPTALKLWNYRASASMSPEMSERLERMAQAAQAYQIFKESGRVTLLDQRGQPMRHVTPTETRDIPPAKPSKRPPARATVTEERVQEAIGQGITGARAIARHLNASPSTVHGILRRMQAARA
jgi:hypothetical protein